MTPAARRCHAAASWPVGGGGSRSSTASRAAAAGSSIRSGSPAAAWDWRASCAPAARIASRSAGVSGAGRVSSAGAGVVWPHLLPGCDGDGG
jgi:hypothetical protein